MGLVAGIELYQTFAIKGPVDNMPALGQAMAWRLFDVKPLREPMVKVTWVHWRVYATPELYELSTDHELNLAILLMFRYNAIQYNTILRVSTQFLSLDIDQTLIPQWYHIMCTLWTFWR